jgi:hypothetical protein
MSVSAELDELKLILRFLGDPALAGPKRGRRILPVGDCNRMA